MAVLFSVIIPTYNRAGFITEAIRSVFNQSFQDFEIIVVDDGSTDQTASVIRSEFNSPKLSYYKKENGERGAARNFGIQKAKGDYVVFLDSDDLFLNNQLEEARNFILDHGPAEVFRLNYYIQDAGQAGFVKNKPLREATVNHALASGNSLSCLGVFIARKTALENLFHENRIMAGLEDWELWLRLASKFPIYNVPKYAGILVHHETRSVLETDAGKLIARVNYFVHLILNNGEITSFYKKQLGLLKSSCYSYLSLHLALTKTRKTISIQYLLKAIVCHPVFVFERRFFAILKNLLV